MSSLLKVDNEIKTKVTEIEHFFWTGVKMNDSIGQAPLLAGVFSC